MDMEPAPKGAGFLLPTIAATFAHGKAARELAPPAVTSQLAPEQNASRVIPTAVKNDPSLGKARASPLCLRDLSL